MKEQQHGKVQQKKVNKQYKLNNILSSEAIVQNSPKMSKICFDYPRMVVGFGRGFIPHRGTE